MSCEPAAVTVPGGRLCYLERGARGAPLVLCLHGFPDHAPTMLPLCEELAAGGYRVVAPWMRGYAPSTGAGPFDMFRLGADVLDLGRELAGGAPFAAVGHDWGAVATYAAALLDPGALSCAVTMAVPHPLAFAAALADPRQLRRSWYMLFFQLPRIPERALARDGFALIRRLWRAWSPGYELPEADWRALRSCLEQSMPAPIEYYRAIRRCFDPGRPRRARIAVPTLYLHGADDGCIGVAATRWQGRLYAEALDSQILEGVGHFLHIEDPAAAARRILSHLARHQPSRAAGA